MKITIELDGEQQDFELPDEVVKALRSIAARNGLTVEAALQQAITNERFLEEQIDDGAKLLVEKDDELREVEFA